MDNNGRKSFVPVLIVASLVLTLKLFMSYNTYGTNDITYWKLFADTIQQNGAFKIYSAVRIYNHPPLMSWILKGISMVSAATGLSFQFVFRLMPILSDYASIFVIWKLLKKYGTANRLFICLACSVNPINFFVSGFHGNSDPVFIFLVLLAVYSIEEDRTVYAGLLYGLSLCVKIVPLLLLPAFLIYLRSSKKRLIFIISCAFVTAAVFVPYLLNDYQAMVKNIFLYSSLKGIWGVGHVCFSIFNNQLYDPNVRRFFYEVAKFHIAYGQMIIFILIILLLKFVGTQKMLNITESVFLSFCTFLAITPGFGVQYLSWLSFFAVIVSPLLGALYMCVGGLFLFRVYYYWSGGKPPFYANSDVVGQWKGFDKTLDITVWLIVIALLTVFLYNKEKGYHAKRNKM